MSDRAFLRAIVTEPADDTARLVYADWLEETGEPVQVARAEFIRAQIQAHTLHPNDPRRAELQGRAAELFAANWVEWWLPVCAAIGLPLPHVSTGGFRERVGRFFGREPPRRGHPYRVDNLTTLGVIQPRPPAPRTTLRAVAFERGFPQWVSLLSELRDTRDAVRAWTNAAPLTALHLHGTVGREWKSIDGEHLHGVRELLLGSAAATAVTAVAQSRNLPRLEELSLRPDRSNIAWPAEQYRAYVDSSLPGRVRWLLVVIGTAEEAAALRGPHLERLCGLRVEGVHEDASYAEDWARVANAARVLLGSPHLSGLKELNLTGAPADIFAGAAPAFAGSLRRLTVQAIRAPSLCEALRRDAFPALVDLSIATSDDTAAQCAALADSPLAGRLRHLRLPGWWGEGDSRRELLRLADALDPERIETLAVTRHLRDEPEVWETFRTRFPGRVSVV
jgi:uncharacterized protein (TIGR02996 family)